jgi:glycosyltransferase involved in cell wall biosynthesis
MSQSGDKISPPRISIAIRAWNEEGVIRRTLENLFEQNLFEELCLRDEYCEVICIPNGCTDRTAEIASAVFAEQNEKHPFKKGFVWRVNDMKQAGRNNTWNAYVHELSHPDAEFLFLMDSDILFNRTDTLFNMYATLLNQPEAAIVSDQPIKDVSLKSRRSWRDVISLATSDMNRATVGQMTGQLYGIRTEVARQLYLPKDLGIDDGFIKALVCTDFFTCELNPNRIQTAPNASHVFEAYTSVQDVMKNQKRQMIGQTTVHVLLEYLKALPPEQRADLPALFRDNDTNDPDWVKRMVQEHLQKKRYFWRLFPDVLTFRLKRWRGLKGVKMLTHFPAAVAGTVVTLVSCAQAHRHFKRGQMHYWPKASREGIQQMNVGTRAPA